MSQVKVAVVGLIVLAAGCSSATRHNKGDAKASDNLAAEVTRICALPAAERDKALQKLKQDSGMVLFCGSKE